MSIWNLSPAAKVVTTPPAPLADRLALAGSMEKNGFREQAVDTLTLASKQATSAGDEVKIAEFAAEHSVKKVAPYMGRTFQPVDTITIGEFVDVARAAYKRGLKQVMTAREALDLAASEVHSGFAALAGEALVKASDLSSTMPENKAIAAKADALYFDAPRGNDEQGYRDAAVHASTRALAQAKTSSGALELGNLDDPKALTSTLMAEHAQDALKRAAELAPTMQEKMAIAEKAIELSLKATHGYYEGNPYSAYRDAASYAFEKAGSNR